jgi:hypothetical protein
VLEHSKRFFSARNKAAGLDENLTGSQFFTAGIVAGLANAAVSGPVEHIRIREHFSLGFQGDPLHPPQVSRRNRIKPGSTTGLGMLSRRFTQPTELRESIKVKSPPSPAKLVVTVCIFGRMKNSCSAKWLRRGSGEIN